MGRASAAPELRLIFGQRVRFESEGGESLIVAAARQFSTDVGLPSAGPRRYTAKVNIRSIIAPTLSRYPTEHQWEELEDQLRRALSQMPRQTIPEALADEPARTVIEDWRHRHWLDESASYLP